MKKKDILELKKRFKKDKCTFTGMSGCYVNGEKNILLTFKENFLNLEEDDFFKYLEIANKVLSGTVGNNILELNFPLNEELINETQVALMQLRNSRLKDDSLLDNFYKSIINCYDYAGNFLIILFHDVYDIITKTKDNLKIDESEEVYEYILCAVCPVSLSEPGLRYFEEENKIEARIRDWVVEAPANGFVFPAFIDRSPDVNSVMYYTKNAKIPHYELMENALGCFSRQTATIQKQTFESIIKDSVGADEEEAQKVFMDIQENLNTMIEEYNAIYDDTDAEPISVTRKDIENLLVDTGLSPEVTTKIEKLYTENFGEESPLAEHLIDAKTLKANEQRRKEQSLYNQIQVLENKLEEFKQDSTDLLDENDSESSLNDEDTLDDVSTENNVDSISNYDIVLQVKPEKVEEITSQIIDGRKCIVIPINQDEQTAVNGQDHLI